MTTMTTKLLDRLTTFASAHKARLRGERGAISAEYVAILLVVAGIVAVVIGLQLDDRARECGNAAKDALFTDAGEQPTC